jgi:hypothetical protein
MYQQTRGDGTSTTAVTTSTTVSRSCIAASPPATTDTLTHCSWPCNMPYKHSLLHCVNTELCHHNTVSMHLQRPLSHLSHSEAQLLTSDVGHTMITRLAMGTPPRLAAPCCSSVHIRLMPCRVLPKPWGHSSSSSSSSEACFGSSVSTYRHGNHTGPCA